MQGESAETHRVSTLVPLLLVGRTFCDGCTQLKVVSANRDGDRLECAYEGEKHQLKLSIGANGLLTRAEVLSQEDPFGVKHRTTISYVVESSGK